MKKLLWASCLFVSTFSFAGNIHLQPGSYVDTDSGDRIFCDGSNSNNVSSSTFLFYSSLFYYGESDTCKKILTELTNGLNPKATEGRGTLSFSCTNEGWGNGKIKGTVNYMSHGSLIKFESKLSNDPNSYRCSTLISKINMSDSAAGASMSFNCVDDSTLVINVLKTMN